VYPNGTGQREAALFWNAGDWGKARLRDPPDDVKFVAALLDDLETVANIDKKRIFATGISNGGMMCYKLAAELSDRTAAIAPIAGTQAFNNAKPKRAVSVLHFHGTADTLVPFDGPKTTSEKFLGFKSIDDTIRTWAKLDGCPEKPKIEPLPDKMDDGTTVRRLTYGPGNDDSEVILIEITGGGHTWPGRSMPIELFGRCTRDISANDMMWEFFQRHPLP
jgi:polyhydroxybutyrate depolymerase